MSPTWWENLFYTFLTIVVWAVIICIPILMAISFLYFVGVL